MAFCLLVGSESSPGDEGDGSESQLGTQAVTGKEFRTGRAGLVFVTLVLGHLGTGAGPAQFFLVPHASGSWPQVLPKC